MADLFLVAAFISHRGADPLQTEYNLTKTFLVRACIL
jgi:hypothetical protein